MTFTCRSLSSLAGLAAFWWLSAGSTPLLAQLPAPPATAAQVDPNLERYLLMKQQYQQLKLNLINITDLDARKQALTQINQLCAAISEPDCAAWYAQLEQVNQAIRTRDEAQRAAKVGAALAAQDRENAELLRQEALRVAISEKDFVKAKGLLDKAAKLDPTNKGLDTTRAVVASAARDALIRRTVGWSLTGLLTVGGLLGLYRLARRAPRVATLEMVLGPEPGETFRLDRETTVVGALQGEVDWVITDPSRRVSRRHFEVTRTGRHYHLVDCSTNGTYVNDEPAPREQPVLLKRGDTITLSEDIVLKFR